MAANPIDFRVFAQQFIDDPSAASLEGLHAALDRIHPGAEELGDLLPHVVPLVLCEIATTSLLAINTLMQLLVNQTMRTLALEAGAVQALVSVIRGSAAHNAKAAAIKTLDEIGLYNSIDNVRTIARVSMPHISALLHSVDEQTAVNSAHAMLGLSAYEYRDYTRELYAPIPARIVRILHTSTSAAIRLDAMWALKYVSDFDDLSFCPAVVQCGALPLVVSALVPAADDRIAAVAVLVLQNMCCNNPSGAAECRAAAVEAGALPKLIHLLRAKKEYATFDVLRVLAEDPQTRDRVVASGAVGTVVGHLARGQGVTFAMQLSATRCFPALARPSLLSSLAVHDSHVVDLYAEIEDLKAINKMHLHRMETLTNTALSNSDVTFQFADGKCVGGSRLLLASNSHYYKSLFCSDADAKTIFPDADFSVEAHTELLRQLHSFDLLPLPADFSLRLELLVLMAKIRAPDHIEDLVSTLTGRCKSSVVADICVGNCLEVLARFMHLDAEFKHLVEIARNVVVNNYAVLVTDPNWAEFSEAFPNEANVLAMGDQE